MAPDTESAPMRLLRSIDLPATEGGFVTLGDLDDDGRVDFLLSYYNEHSAHVRLIALDHDGRQMWEAGDPSIVRHTSSNPCRGICVAYDIDGNGSTEVLAELWNDGAPLLALFDGATGEVKALRESPFDMNVREPAPGLLRPGVTRPSRSAPAVALARFAGPDALPSIVAKIDTSNTAPPYVVCLDAALDTAWDTRPKHTAVGHHMSVADVDADGRDEVVFGELAVDGDGTAIFERDFGFHADMTDVFETTDGEVRIIVSICSSGPLYCLNAAGQTVWQKSSESIPHGQAAWAGRFAHDSHERQVIALKSGHYGQFVTFEAETGAELWEFEHRDGIVDEHGERRYPDMPTVFRWSSPTLESLWVPVDRRLVDGRGRTVAELGALDAEVARRLAAGTSKQHLAVQAIAADICGDEREEAVLYQPYQGTAIYLFTQADSDCREKPYVHRSAVYNRKSYF